MQFKKVQEAFDMIMSKLEEDEFEKRIVDVEFNATLRKVICSVNLYTHIY
jgi:hypothetical protein